MKIRVLLPVLMLIGTVASLLVGCKDNAEPCVLIIECDDVVAKKPVEVDLIGVTVSDKPEWEKYSVSNYWQPGNRKRASATDKITRKFGEGHTNRYVLCLGDAEVNKTWKTWFGRGVTELIVIANLRPRDASIVDADGNADPRRKNIPLKPKVLKELYPDAKAFRIFVQDASIRIDPLDKIPPDAKKCSG